MKIFFEKNRKTTKKDVRKFACRENIDNKNTMFSFCDESGKYLIYAQSTGCLDLPLDFSEKDILKHRCEAFRGIKKRKTANKDIFYTLLISKYILLIEKDNHTVRDLGDKLVFLECKAGVIKDLSFTLKFDKNGKPTI